MKISLISNPSKIYFTLGMLFSACLFSCKSDKLNDFKISGSTMGTTYNINYSTESNIENLKSTIDSILVAINDEVSTYEPHSIISRFNKSKSSFCLEKPNTNDDCNGCHFYTIYKSAEQVYHKSSENFDPTIMPLINYWGFGYKKKRAVKQVDKDTIRQILEYVGFDKVDLNIDKTKKCKSSIEKKHDLLELDFSAIAKGYAVDYLADFLKRGGINNYMVEIGGEVVCAGVNAKMQPWKIGINTPLISSGIRDFKAIVKLKNKALATSGNYRNFYEVGGRKYGHEINPKSGYPEKNELLSVSVVANSCMDADAYATACMIMGLEAANTMIESEQSLEAYFIYGNEDGGMDVKYTAGFAPLLVDMKKQKIEDDKK